MQATYLGGSNDDEAFSLAFDGGGNLLVAGSTVSTDFPGTIGGAQPNYGGGGFDGFVARLSSNLTTLVQATYLGGSNSDGANALAIDARGNVLVAGATISTNFPGTIGGVQPANGGSGDAFVARLSSSLATLMQATYLGGNGIDQAQALALDPAGNVLVAGYASSTNFSGTAGGAQPTNGSGSGTDAFVAKLTANLRFSNDRIFLNGFE